MTETHTPLPCPFCGGEQICTAPDHKFRDITWDVICKACGASVSRDLEAEALTAWNTRAVNSHHDLIEALRAATDALERLYLKAVVGTDAERHAALEGAFTAMENGRAILTKEAGRG